MNELKRTKGKVRVSAESVLNLRLSVLESKVDLLRGDIGRILSILAPVDREKSMSDDLESAILAHLLGDRGPIEELERRWGITK